VIRRLTAPFRGGVNDRNLAFYFLYIVVVIASAGIMTEGYIQTYLLKLGFDARRISYFGFTSQISSIITFVVLSNFNPLKKNALRMYSLAVYCFLIQPACLACVGIFGMGLQAAFILIIVMTAVLGFLSAFRSTAEYGLIRHLFKREQFGTVYGRAGITGGILAAGLSLATGAVISDAPFPTGYIIIFIISGTFMAAAGTFTLFFVRKTTDAGDTAANVKYSTVLRVILDKKYYIFLFPFLLRGVSIACFYFIMPAVLRRITLTGRDMTAYIAIGVLSSTVGYFLFLKLQRKVRLGLLAFAANAVFSACVIYVCFCESVPVFFVFYALFIAADLVAIMAMVTGIMHTVPVEDLPMITSVRMLLTTGVSSVVIIYLGNIFDAVSPAYIMLVGGVLYTFIGFMFWKNFRNPEEQD